MLIVYTNEVMEQINEHKNESYHNCATQIVLVTLLTILIEYTRWLQSKYHHCKEDVIMHGIDDLKYCLSFILMKLWNKIRTLLRLNLTILITYKFWLQSKFLLGVTFFTILIKYKLWLHQSIHHCKENGVVIHWIHDLISISYHLW